MEHDATQKYKRVSLRCILPYSGLEMALSDSSPERVHSQCSLVGSHFEGFRLPKSLDSQNSPADLKDSSFPTQSHVCQSSERACEMRRSKFEIRSPASRSKASLPTTSFLHLTLRGPDTALLEVVGIFYFPVMATWNRMPIALTRLHNIGETHKNLCQLIEMPQSAPCFSTFFYVL